MQATPAPGKISVPAPAGRPFSLTHCAAPRSSGVNCAAGSPAPGSDELPRLVAEQDRRGPPNTAAACRAAITAACRGVGDADELAAQRVERRRVLLAQPRLAAPGSLSREARLLTTSPRPNIIAKVSTWRACSTLKV